MRLPVKLANGKKNTIAFSDEMGWRYEVGNIYCPTIALV